MDVVNCELCGLEHMAGAVRCDGCDQILGQRLDVMAMREELRRIKLRSGYFSAVTIAMLVGNFVLFQGAGIILFTLPMAIVIHNAWRWRALSKYLKAGHRSQQKTD